MLGRTGTAQKEHGAAGHDGCCHRAGQAVVASLESLLATLNEAAVPPEPNPCPWQLPHRCVLGDSTHGHGRATARARRHESSGPRSRADPRHGVRWVLVTMPARVTNPRDWRSRRPPAARGTWPLVSSVDINRCSACGKSLSPYWKSRCEHCKAPFEAALLAARGTDPASRPGLSRNVTRLILVLAGIVIAGMFAVVGVFLFLWFVLWSITT